MRFVVSPSPYARSVGVGWDKRTVDPWPSWGLMNMLPTSRRIATYQGILRSLQPKKELTGNDILSTVLEGSLARYHQMGFVGNATLALFGSLENQEAIVEKHSQGVFEVTEFGIWPALGYLTGAGIIDARTVEASDGSPSPSLYRIAGDYSGGTYAEVSSVGSLTSRSFRLA